MGVGEEVAGPCPTRSFLLFHRRENSFNKPSAQAAVAGGAAFPSRVLSEAHRAGQSPGSPASAATPWLGRGLPGWSGQAHSQADATDVTLVILVESSDHGCRFCRAKSDEL